LAFRAFCDLGRAVVVLQADIDVLAAVTSWIICLQLVFTADSHSATILWLE